MDEFSRQEISKGILELNNTNDQLDIMDIYRLFHPTTVEYTFLSSLHETFTRIDHTLGHKTHFNKLKK